MPCTSFTRLRTLTNPARLSDDIHHVSGATVEKDQCAAVLLVALHFDNGTMRLYTDAGFVKIEWTRDEIRVAVTTDRVKIAAEKVLFWGDRNDIRACEVEGQVILSWVWDSTRERIKKVCEDEVEAAQIAKATFPLVEIQYPAHK